jgi:hypothetical protein
MPLRGTRPDENGVGAGYPGRGTIRRGLRPCCLWSLEAAEQAGPGHYVPAPGAPGDGEPAGQAVDGAGAPIAPGWVRPAAADREGIARRETVAGPEHAPAETRPRDGGKGVVCAGTHRNFQGKPTGSALPTYPNELS